MAFLASKRQEREGIKTSSWSEQKKTLVTDAAAPGVPSFLPNSVKQQGDIGAGEPSRAM